MRYSAGSGKPGNTARGAYQRAQTPNRYIGFDMMCYVLYLWGLGLSVQRGKDAASVVEGM